MSPWDRHRLREDEYELCPTPLQSLCGRSVTGQAGRHWDEVNIKLIFFSS